MMAPTNQERTERSRRAILDAAAPVFSQQGYAAASLNRIIEESGLTKGGFYFHFPSKQDLALAVLADHRQQLMTYLAREVAGLPRAVDRLFETPRVLARLAAQGKGPADFGAMIGELAQDPDLRDEVCGSIRVWIDQVAVQFREAQDEGSIRSDIDAATLAQIAIGAFIGVQSLTAQLADDDLERRVDDVTALFRMALVSGGDPPARRRSVRPRSAAR
jgi:AcrR family transcriptional regulator